ncbi:MAG: hypothetical protein ACJAYC_001506 [Halieaceae bacterium]|jgi:hypothetical protein
MDTYSRSYPGTTLSLGIFSLIALTVILTIGMLLQVEDMVQLKILIEDSGPVQMTGQLAIELTFAGCLLSAIVSSQRRASFLPLSYLTMFYFLREADFHYKVSEFAKATQFKRFYLHEMIPLSTKLFMASIIILFLVVLVKYLRREKAVFLKALRHKVTWAWFAVCWFMVFGVSQVIDQIPLFHTEKGQVFEEVFEASAEVIALLTLILFWIQVWGTIRAKTAPNTTAASTQTTR